MHPVDPATSLAVTSVDLSSSGQHSTVSRSSSTVEPDPFKHATDISQCVTCGAQITVSH